VCEKDAATRSAGKHKLATAEHAISYDVIMWITLILDPRHEKKKKAWDRELKRNEEIMKTTDEECNATAGAQQKTERSCNDEARTQEPAKSKTDTW